MLYDIMEPMPISTESTTNVVTMRDATKVCVISAKHFMPKRRPLSALHKSKCSPRTDNSMGDVSAVSPNDAVLQHGIAIEGTFMKTSSRAADQPNEETTGYGAHVRPALVDETATMR
jgi:hypothetical protein